MAIRISGPGVGLPIARGTLPSRRNVGNLGGLLPFTPPTSRIELLSGEMLFIPAGNWIVSSRGSASVLEYSDQVSGQWQPLLPPVLSSTGGPAGPWATQLFSDGFNYRVINLSQIGYAGVVTAPGSGYVQATTTVTPSAGNSIWHAVVGGSLSLSVTTAGLGYTIPPVIVIPGPPPLGHWARGSVTLAADGSVASVTVVDPGAGYKEAPPVYIVEDPNDPNINELTRGHVISQLTGAGTVTAVLLENFGAPLPAAPALTITGSGTGATAVVDPTTWVAPVADQIVLQPAAG